MTHRWMFEFTHQMALLPLLWLSIQHGRGRSSGLAWWWIACAYAISWLADNAAHVIDPWTINRIYPVSQAAIIGAVFLCRLDALRFTLTLMTVGIVCIFVSGMAFPDICTHTVAWLTIVGIVWDRWALGWLRSTLIISFGLGLIGYIAYAYWPSWPTWTLYHSIRLIGMFWFCWASVHTTTRLNLISGRSTCRRTKI